MVFGSTREQYCLFDRYVQDCLVMINACFNLFHLLELVSRNWEIVFLKLH